MPAYPSVETVKADMTAVPGEQRHEALIASPFEVETRVESSTSSAEGLART